MEFLSNLNIVMNILINEDDIKNGLKVITRFYSYFEIRMGAFSYIERLKIKYPKCNILYSHNCNSFKKAFLKRNPKIKIYKNEKIDKIFYPDMQVWDMIKNINTQIEEDYKIIFKKLYFNSLNISNFDIIGKKEDLIINKNVSVYPFVVFDTTEGNIIIEKNVKISSFSLIKGPIFIGENSEINNAKISSSVIGKNCKIGGEISNSIIQDFTNKNHEGFLGHSFLSSWVNIGALATTSNLKNNYGIVKITEEDKIINTNCIKFGSILGNFVKIGIGNMLNTGTIIDIGSSIFENQTKKYIRSFSWGLEQRYEINKFIQDTKKILKRRNSTLLHEEESLIKELFQTVSYETV